MTLAVEIRALGDAKATLACVRIAFANIAVRRRTRKLEADRV